MLSPTSIVLELPSLTRLVTKGTGVDVVPVGTSSKGAPTARSANPSPLKSPRKGSTGAPIGHAVPEEFIAGTCHPWTLDKAGRARFAACL